MLTSENVASYWPALEALRDGELEELGEDGKWYPANCIAKFCLPYRFRRRPKPREWWVQIWSDGSKKVFDSRHNAENWRGMAGGEEPSIIHVREVI